MPGYVIVNVRVTDPERFERYRVAAPATVAQYGGEYLVRGGPFEVMEGSWSPTRLVLLRFESAARAREWVTSPEYTEVRRLREGAAEFEVVIVEG